MILQLLIGQDTPQSVVAVNLGNFRLCRGVAGLDCTTGPLDSFRALRPSAKCLSASRVTTGSTPSGSNSQQFAAIVSCPAQMRCFSASSPPPPGHRDRERRILSQPQDAANQHLSPVTAQAVVASDWRTARGFETTEKVRQTTNARLCASTIND